MDIFNLVNNIFSSFFPVASSSKSEAPSQPNIEAKAETEPSDLDRETATLEDYLGVLDNRTLTITLQELNAIIPRRRVRIDAYAKLTRHLKATRNAILTITSRKSRQ